MAVQDDGDVDSRLSDQVPKCVSELDANVVTGDKNSTSMFEI